MIRKIKKTETVNRHYWFAIKKIEKIGIVSKNYLLVIGKTNTGWFIKIKKNWYYFIFVNNITKNSYGNQVLKVIYKYTKLNLPVLIIKKMRIKIDEDNKMNKKKDRYISNNDSNRITKFK